MTNESSAVRVSVAPGSGRIARRAGALLFDPTGDNGDLLVAFDLAASDEAAIVVVKQHLIDVGFDASPVVVIDWRAEGLELLVFGDADVRTSAVAAPNINGAGSGTWIERYLGALELGDADEVQVWCGDETDGATDLRLGLVRAGGVRLSMKRAANPRPVPEAAAPIAHGSGRPDAAPAPVEAGFIAGADELEWSDTEPQPASPQPKPEPQPHTAAAPPQPAPPQSSSPQPASPQSKPEPGPQPAEPEPGPQPAAASSAAATLTDPFTAPARSAEHVFEDAATEPLRNVAVAGGASNGGLVEATLCSNGHANPPRHTVCQTCAVEIDPGAALTLIAQPSVGHLRFSGGDVVEVATELVIGRKPTPESANARPVVVDHAEVSRSHVKVVLDGWSALVTDLGSRNGTWVIPPSDATPIKLDAEVPYLLEHGTTVHLGGPEASFTYDFGVG